jgi:hypothetical protein
MHILAYTTAIIFGIAFLDTQDVYYLILGIIAAILGISIGKD